MTCQKIFDRRADGIVHEHNFLQIAGRNPDCLSWDVNDAWCLRKRDATALNTTLNNLDFSAALAVETIPMIRFVVQEQIQDAADAFY